jgi:dienelactone hydrolase
LAIQTRLVDYEDAGVVLEGLIAWDDAVEEPRPGILVSHAWAGRGEFEDQKARQLAELGYVGFALDLYGKGKRGSSTEENAALMQPFLDDRGMLQKRLLGSLNTMRTQPEVDPAKAAAIGFCFGGLCVLDIARTGEDLAGVVSFHGLFGSPGNTAGQQITAKVLALLAEELTSAGADWQLHAYGNTMHAFTNPDANDPGFGTVYSKQADNRSWAAMCNFLAELFE